MKISALTSLLLVLDALFLVAAEGDAQEVRNLRGSNKERKLDEYYEYDDDASGEYYDDDGKREASYYTRKSRGLDYYNPYYDYEESDANDEDEYYEYYEEEEEGEEEYYEVADAGDGGYYAYGDVDYGYDYYEDADDEIGDDIDMHYIDGSPDGPDEEADDEVGDDLDMHYY